MTEQLAIDFDKARAQRRAYVGRDIAAGLICDTPAARVTDPDTSHEAADFIRATSKANHQQRILDCVQRLPGLTVIEIARQVGLDHVRVGKRMSELETAQRIVRGEKRRVGKLNYCTWFPT